ncbi:DUF432 domain-containing protein [Aliiglaciecola sp. LCG003]|uniref:DUF432 domain-containing protein n=1 Tax=Aliiglaciecola sp. LCG003 TaxID=3053655 RepID=UPI0025741E3B|nr:DUF432 domain-containing protein [Aliiglaciecola sp. LCG003]WJG09114.1 DUF432 domain-containing protein [Aliiglaciecola sp. LCG003]
MTKRKDWWGEFNFNLAQTRCWRIAERVIAIKRSGHEWTIWNKETEFELDKPILTGAPKATESFQDVDFNRYMLSNTSETLIIEPSLADRAMVARPSRPFIIMPEEEIKIYVSTPLWMTILIPHREVPIADIPFWRPSDSWFGPNTMKGDICYSKYTDAKMDRSLLEKRSHRASTMVILKNAQEEPLKIERLNLPVPALKLYVDQDGEFWTDQISILQRMEHAKSVSHVRHTPPEDIQNMLQVSESRELSKKSSFLSSIKSLVD